MRVLQSAAISAAFPLMIAGCSCTSFRHVSSLSAESPAPTGSSTNGIGRLSEEVEPSVPLRDDDDNREAAFKIKSEVKGVICAVENTTQEDTAKAEGISSAQADMSGDAPTAFKDAHINDEDGDAKLYSWMRGLRRHDRMACKIF